MKKKFSTTILLIVLAIALQALAQECPFIGAIRWDAWHGEKGSVGSHEEKILSLEKWRYRLPFCSKILNTTVRIDCANAEAMTKEIMYASEAKLDYWAFLAYEPNDPMSLQLREFVQNAKRDYIKLALILEFGRWSPQNYVARNNYLSDLISQKNYLKIKERPVVFIFNITGWENRLYNLWGGPTKFREAVINDLIRKIGTKPYFVVMDFNPQKAAYWANIFDFDAISTYATHPNKKGSYEDLVRHTMNWWEKAKKTGKTVIPIVMTGWDPRPRAQLPAPWQTKEYIEQAKEVYFDTPNPEQIAEFVRKAIRWARSNGSPAVIIYAWNELSEGGWIMPTLTEGDKRIKAIKKVMTEECEK